MTHAEVLLRPRLRFVERGRDGANMNARHLWRQLSMSHVSQRHSADASKNPLGKIRPM